MKPNGRQVFYSGRVQGVGFRYTARQLARGHEVRGWVRNLSDGRVELQVCGEGGEPREVGEFLQAILDSPLGQHIEEVEVREIELPEDEARGFRILGSA